MHECRDRARMLDSYLDGELEATKLIEIDEHVGACDTCREETQLLRAMRVSLKRVVKTTTASGLRERIGIAMAAERARDDARTDVEPLGAGLGGNSAIVNLASWRTMVPLATAAALALMWSGTTRTTQTATREVRAGFGDDLLAELVAEHSQPLPPEAKDAQAVRGLERYVGVPVRPGSFERAGAHLVGGRVLPLHSQRAAVIQYLVGSGSDERRVSVFVYDAQKIRIGTANFEPHAVGTAEVRVGREKGYSVAAMQRGGVGYLVASDLDPERSAQLAAMVYDDHY